MSYVPHSQTDVREMLKTIGIASPDELFSAIPAALRLKRPLAIPDAMSEWDAVRTVSALAAEDAPLLCFAGGGLYDHWVPSIVDHVLRRSEFYTAYTPYQPEVSQGTLQVIYEFQTMMCELSGMDVANASMYDGASACAEAAILAGGVKRDRHTVVMARTVHPHFLSVTKTYLGATGRTIAVAPRRTDGTLDLAAAGRLLGQASCLVVQQPNFLGVLEDLEACAAAAHAAGALLVVAFNPIAAAVLNSPGACGADVAVAEGQPLGIPMSYGGPVLGVFAAKNEYIRHMPGRIAGIARDHDGRRGFVLTLQTREQHIRREKATSNICTNQGLMALAATVYLATVGLEGLKGVAEASCVNAHAAFDAVTKIKGYAPLCPGGEFFHEFAVRTPKPAAEIVRSAAAKGVLAGVALDRFATPMEDANALLIAVTEKRTAEDVEALVEVLTKA
ncbi:MAG TPA: aminomethyl-transferring glycine dehydrogenase subunit GcvPA [Gemmatimonadales bacterium]|nr:aminomethyl-transferring glycine dehydrogenase subunit GcvPA [Gemmatimonadales bacterium]